MTGWDYPQGTSDKDINQHFGEPTKFSEFIEAHEDDFLEGWLKEHPEHWELFQLEVVKPTGRPYEAIIDASIELWEQFKLWFFSDDLRTQEWESWIENNMPDYYEKGD